MFLGMLMSTAVMLHSDRLTLQAKRTELEGCVATIALKDATVAKLTQRAEDAEEKLSILVKMFCMTTIVCAILFRKEMFHR